MSKVVITNVTGFRITGVEAFTKPMITFLLEKFDSITVLSDDPEYDRYRYAHNSIQESSYRVSFEKTPHDKKGYRSVMIEADLIVSLGGDVFSSSYGDLDRHVLALVTASELGIRIAMVGHTFGPFTSKKDFSMFLKAIKNVDFISTRDEASYALIEGLNLACVLVRGSDPAFEYSQPIPHQGWFENMYPSSDICIAPVQPIVRWLGIDEKTHVWWWKRIIEELARDGHRITLLPFGQYFGGSADSLNDDAYLVMNIFDDLDYHIKDNVSLLNPYHQVEYFIYQISRSKLVVSERMHSVILSIAQGVVPLTFGYANKHRRILEYLYESDFLDFYHPLGSFDVDNALKHIRHSLNDLDIQSQKTQKARMKAIRLHGKQKIDLENFIGGII